MPAAPNRKALREAIRVLRHFADIDLKLQVSTALTLLEIAERDDAALPTSTRDLEDIIGYQPGTSSRNIYFWADGHEEMPHGGLGYVTVGLDSEDRRTRDLRLTRRGRAFLRNTIFAGSECDG